jgi:Family of unknown function (DUF6437)
VAKKTVNALNALNKLIEEQKALAERAEAARTAAALELGMVVLDAGGVALTAGQLKVAVEAAVAAAKTTSAKRVGVPGTGGANG